MKFEISKAIAAFWAGHSPAVAEKHYLSYVFGNNKDSSIDSAMSIHGVLKLINKQRKHS